MAAGVSESIAIPGESPVSLLQTYIASECGLQGPQESHLSIER